MTQSVMLYFGRSCPDEPVRSTRALLRHESDVGVAVHGKSISL